MSFPVTSVGQDAMCLSNSGRDDSEKPPANLDLISRKRFRCRPDASDHVPPAKKNSLTSRDDCQKHTSEVREALSGQDGHITTDLFLFFPLDSLYNDSSNTFTVNNSGKTV